MKGVGPATPAWMGSVDPAGGQPLLPVAQRPRIEAELGGDVHGEAGGPGKGLLALERLPEHLVRYHAVALGMAGHADPPDSRVADYTAFEQLEGARERGIAESPRSPAISSNCCTPPAASDAKSIAQTVCIDDPPRNDMRRSREPELLETQRDANHVVRRRLRRIRHVDAENLRAGCAPFRPSTFSSCGVTSVDPAATKSRSRCLRTRVSVCADWTLAFMRHEGTCVRARDEIACSDVSYRCARRIRRERKLDDQRKRRGARCRYDAHGAHDGNARTSDTDHHARLE